MLFLMLFLILLRLLFSLTFNNPLSLRLGFVVRLINFILLIRLLVFLWFVSSLLDSFKINLLRNFYYHNHCFFLNYLLQIFFILVNIHYVIGVRGVHGVHDARVSRGGHDAHVSLIYYLQGVHVSQVVHFLLFF